MGMLDFIKNRGAQRESETPQAKPETAKEMYTREAVQEKAAQRSPVSLSPEQQSKVQEVQGTMKEAMQQPGQAPLPTPSPEGATNPQPMAQRGMREDKAAPALSPTSAQAGTREHEQEKTSPSPAVTPQRTVPRPPPSWER